MICTGQIEGRGAENGFSAPELIVVITVIALLSAIAAISYYNIQERERADNWRANLQIIEVAKTRWLKDHFVEGDPAQSGPASESVQCSAHGKYRQVTTLTP